MRECDGELNGLLNTIFSPPRASFKITAAATFLMHRKGAFRADMVARRVPAPDYVSTRSVESPSQVPEGLLPRT